MKTLILLLTLVSSIFAVNLNDSLLKVHSTLLPKMYLMDYNFQKKLKDNTIIIAIMYANNEYKDAKRLRKMIETRYPNGIKTYNIQAKLIRYSNIQISRANIYYLFPTNTQKIKKVIKKAATNGAITFSYLQNDLKYGVMISLNVSKRIKPLLNLEAIKKNKIALRPILIEISTIYKNHTKLNRKHLDIESSLMHRIYQASL